MKPEHNDISDYYRCIEHRKRHCVRYIGHWHITYLWYICQ